MLRNFLLGSTVLAASALVGVGMLSSEARAQQTIAVTGATPANVTSTGQTGGVTVNGALSKAFVVNVPSGTTGTLSADGRAMTISNTGGSATNTLIVNVNEDFIGRATGGIQVGNTGFTTLNIASGKTVGVTANGVKGGTASAVSAINVTATVANALTIENSGTITSAGTTAATAVISVATGAAGVITINNKANATISSTAAAATRFAITLQAANDVVTNAGTIQGAINLGAGNNSLTVTAGNVYANTTGTGATLNVTGTNILAGAGNDTYAQSGGTVTVASGTTDNTGIDLGSGANVVNISGGTLQGNYGAANQVGGARVQLEGGNDIVRIGTNAGATAPAGGGTAPALGAGNGATGPVVRIGTLDLGAGTNTLNIAGATVTGGQSAAGGAFGTGTITGGAVVDTITIGQAAGASSDAGTPPLTVVQADINLAASGVNTAQTVTFNATTGVPTSNNAGDSLSISGGTVTGDITGGSDNDFVDISGGTYTPAGVGETDDINLDGGHNVLVIRGTANVSAAGSTADPANAVDRIYTGGTGVDKVYVRGGTITGSISLDAEADELHVSGGIVNSYIDTGAGNDVINLTGGTINAPGLNVGAGDDTINFSGTGSAVVNFVTVTGTPSFTSAGTNTLNVGSAASSTGSLTLENRYTGTNNVVNPGGLLVNVENGATLNLRGTFGSATTAANTFGNINVGSATTADSEGTLSVNGVVNLGTSNLEVQAGSTLNFVPTDNSADGAGTIRTATGNITLGTGTGATNAATNRVIVTLTPAAGFSPAVGTVYTILTDADTDFTVDTAENRIRMGNNTGLLTYTVGRSADNNSVTVTTSYNSAASIISGNPEAVATINALTANSSTEGEVLGAINTAAAQGSAALVRAAEQIAPPPNAAPAAATHVTQSTQIQIGQRLASLYDSGEGIATGDGDAGQGDIWINPYGFTGEQDRRSGVAGYDIDGYGIMGGFDVNAQEGLILGAGLGYSDSEVDGKSAANSKTDVDAITVFVTASVEAGSGIVVDGQLGYSALDFDSSSTINFGGLNRTRKGSYDGDQIFASGRVTMDDLAGGGDYFMVPSVGLIYSTTEFDSYTETGAGSLNRRVTLSDVDALVGDITGRFGFEQQMDDGVMEPSISIGVNYDFITDRGVANHTTAGSTTSVRTQGADPSAFGGLLGLGLVYASDDGVHEVGVDYTGNFKSDYDSHTGSLQYTMNF